MSRLGKKRQALVQKLDWQLRSLSTSTVLAFSAVARRAGLGPNELKCGEILVREGPMSAGELGQKAGLTTGAITGIVDRLENVGWAKRVPDPEDRRRIIIHPGPQDSATMAGLYENYMASLYNLLDKYSDQELVLISEFIESMTKLNHEQAQTV